MKDKNNIIISIDDQKPFNKILQTFVIKILSNVRVERTFHNVIKAIYEKPTASTILNGEKKNSLRSGTRQDCLLSPLLFSIVWK